MLPSTCPSTYRSSLPDKSPLMTTDLPICAKSADNGALISVLLKDAGYCNTKILGRQAPGRRRCFFRLYPTQRACGKRGTSVTQEKTALKTLGKHTVQPSRRIVKLTIA